MKARQLEKLGVPAAHAKLAKWLAQAARQGGLTTRQVQDLLHRVIDEPQDHRNDPHFGELATILAQRQEAAANAAANPQASEPAPCHIFGQGLDPASLQQMENARRLAVSVQAALMPDAHVGYGIPIGGVLATDNAVIPYAVGVDIACRMKLTVLDLPVETLTRRQDWLSNAIERETQFGIGSEFKHRRSHPVMDEDWSVSPVTQYNRDKAHAQLGTSGSGNHFVEFGELTVGQAEAAGLGLPQAGSYLALLSHSGSRGVGAAVCQHYSNMAMRLHPELPRELRHLAWLGLDTHEGQEYWVAMNLMGHYAAANHALIHRHIARHLGAHVLADIENHHNFAWKERHGGRELIVHRKGATPAGRDVLGIIPGSMASPGYVVRGKGNPQSLDSAAHGAGRLMSRTQARQTYRWNHVRQYLADRGVTVLSAGVDEVPFVYKNIDEVMAQQQELVEVVARFDPRLVKMAPGGDRPED